jgi:hypothetical protein
MFFINGYRLDTGGAEFNAKYSFHRFASFHCGLVDSGLY